MKDSTQADVIVVGAGIAGLVAAYELTQAGKTVLLLDQEGEQNMGGQAFWSFGGLFFVDSPEQRRLFIKDSRELALEDWMGSAGFDREEDHWPKRWAEAYIDFASGEKRSWLYDLGMRFFPIVGWAERGGGSAIGHGNSVPRFHVTWGTGPGVVEPFEWRLREAASRGLVHFKFRHQVKELLTQEGRVIGVAGKTLAPTSVERGAPSNREVVGDFEFRAEAVVVASGGVGANLKIVRKHWPKRLGKAPKSMIKGVPDHVDGLMLESTEKAGARLVNRDRMWHYCEGIKNWSPIWTDHGIRILPGPSSIWLDAEGNRFPHPYSPGFDTLGTLEQILKTGYDYSWFILNQRIIEKEFALSGSEQNPDLTNKSVLGVIRRIKPGAPAPVEAFKQKGEDFIVESDLPTLVERMNALTDEPLLDLSKIEHIVTARDLQVDNPFCKDGQLAALRSARAFWGDKILRTVKPHRILDPAAGPLIAVRLHILTRKSLGGVLTDLQARALNDQAEAIPGLYAVGEAAGFGGGGMHGYRALEGTFLGGCIFSGRQAGRAIADAL
ncbi:MAG: FAD-binding dehydrogenase [Candidatus Eremiobacteraeota bacterium]|nr:FAD-binding dehydrogenase [Candidatus Eremiobacteraeota bacterium]